MQLHLLNFTNQPCDCLGEHCKDGQGAIPTPRDSEPGELQVQVVRI